MTTSRGQCRCGAILKISRGSTTLRYFFIFIEPRCLNHAYVKLKSNNILFMWNFRFSGLEIGLRPKTIHGVGLSTGTDSTPDWLGLHSQVRAHLKVEELLFPIAGRLFQISISLRFFCQFSLFSDYFDPIKKISINKVQNVFLLRYRMALLLSNKPSYDSVKY